jgi:ATP-dependent RNA helicase HelY
VTPIRQAFAAARSFPFDPFQERALDAIDEGGSVLVAAPTGSGKTVVAEYAVARALAEGSKAFYTTPLKALSNQKYGDLARMHGGARIGLLTGDNSLNGDAPAVVMTTEVLRNMIYAGSPALAGLRWVVLDEVHYLQNPYRGAVWEEVIIHLPAHVALVCLSATVSNAEEFGDWLRTVRGDATVVIEERRPVDLTHLYLVGERGTESLRLLPTFVADDRGEPRPNPEAARVDARGTRGRGGPRRGGPVSRGRGPGGGGLRPPRRADYAELLAEERMLPAISFVFSRAGCDQAVQQCVDAGLRLTDTEERAAIRRIADAHTDALGDEDLAVLRGAEWRHGLECGFAAHHAGMVPPMKEAVEEAFAAGLVKVVFATETLSLGINMPARSVVIEKLSKFTGERHEFLTAGEYTQLTGRAGRRGIDERGFAVVCWSPFVPFDQVAGLASRRTHALTSSFRPTYNMTANLVHRYEPERAHHLLNLSFAQYRADRDVVALERRLDRDREVLDRHRADAACERGDVAEYRARLDAWEGRRGRATDRSAIPAAISSLRPGDVLLVGRGHGRVVVLKQDHGRGGARVLTLGAGRELVRLGPSDFDAPPRPVATIDLPAPFAPRNPGFRRRAAETLRRVRTADPRAAEQPDEPALADPDDHPVAGCPDRRRHLRALVAAERVARDVSRLERRVRSRNESLARQFDRVHRVLEAWGYVDGWQLTDGGRLLMRIYSECDLLVAESLRRGALDGLRPAELAGLASCYAYERRGPDDAPARPPGRWPTPLVGRRFRDIDRIWRDLVANEDDAGLPETRAPDPGLVGALHDWAGGEPLADVLDEDDELTGGDFVRTVKQCIDLLRQIAEVAPSPETAAAARSAADACFRGVVAASSVVGT